MFKHTCTVENAQKFWDWIEHRGGVALWKSINLSDPGASWSTPALTAGGDPMCKPHWGAESEPTAIFTNPEKIGVVFPEEVKRFHVAVRRGSNGMMLKVTSGGTRRIERELEKSGDGSWYEFDYGDYNNAVILRPGKTISLKEWAENTVSVG